MGNGKEKQGYFSFPIITKKPDSYSSPGLQNDKCSGKALEIDDLIKIASHTKTCWGRIARNLVTNLKDVTEYPTLLCAYCCYPYGNLDALISPVNIPIFHAHCNACYLTCEITDGRGVACETTSPKCFFLPHFAYDFLTQFKH